MRVLILCTGNSCRSQMAHGFLQSFCRDLEVHSAGTKPAERVNPKAIEVMKEVGIDLSNHSPKSVELYLNDAWDYVITVCGGANESAPVSRVMWDSDCTSVLTTLRMQRVRMNM